ncbi:MAG: hypothetical protein LQ340_001929 [Diploschistes diacapsis]|nr:MAG: hypothetical protein LQ340_001929 [Diploschistes diacapsis]
MRVYISYFLLVGRFYVHAAPQGVSTSAVCCPAPTVQTSSGNVTGIINVGQPDVRQYLGIPFAQPPVKALRWEPPQKLPQSAASRTVRATRLPPSCPQYLTTRGDSVYKNDVLQFNLQGLNVTGATSEDCLTLSLWAPAANEEKRDAAGGRSLLPVLIFMYGGGFSTGGENVPYQLPPHWVQRTQDHIVVSFNYRLNIFGFPNAAGLKEQNLGTLDQRMAVEWLLQNIQHFGGDPSRMTLWGQSAGAGSVDFYNYAYYSDPIVNGLIMDSGTAFLTSLSSDLGHSNFSFVASKVGCPGLSTEPQAQLSCMRKVPASAIEAFVQQYQDNGTSPGISFVPISDNQTIFSNYTNRAMEGKLAKIPAIVGNNAQDGVPFAPYNQAGPNETIVAKALLSIFFCPATETVRLRNVNKLPTFRYVYAGNFSNISPRPWMGAYHSAELPLLFGTFDNFRGTGPDLENQTSIALQDAWVAFAKDGVNGLEGTGWQPYQLGGADAREFGAGVAAQDTSLSSLEAQCNGPLPAA